VRAGGATPPGPGFFYPPTVLTGVDHTMKVMREETFGPVLPIMAVDSVDEAIRLANDTEYGLTASAWTADAAAARRIAGALSAGVVTVNDCLSSFGDPAAPWGGVKNSGIGRSHGLLGLREMVSAKYVATEFGGRPSPWWYPYGPEFRRFMEAALPALHARGPGPRLRGLLALARSARFWQRARLSGIVKGLDRIFG
jgi:succinate-semialdehyde dehydrogenase/glutarate-semialdehyde dehydrogenase